MGFKIGDVIYCVDNNETILKLNCEYTIYRFCEFGMSLFIDKNSIYHPDRFKSYKTNIFVSEQDYKIIKRKEKLLKLKNEIQNRRCNLLY